MCKSPSQQEMQFFLWRACFNAMTCKIPQIKLKKQHELLLYTYFINYDIQYSAFFCVVLTYLP